MRRGILDTIGGAIKTAGSNYMAMPRDQRFLMGAGMFTDGVGGMAQGYAAGAEMADMAAQRKRRGILDTRADAEWEAKQQAARDAKAAEEAFLATVPEGQQAAARMAPQAAATQALKAPDPQKIRPLDLGGEIAFIDDTGREVLPRQKKSKSPNPPMFGFPPPPGPGFVPEQ